MTPDELRIAGFLDPRRALSFFEELPGGAEAWERDLGASADPDQALLAAIRLHEADPGSWTSPTPGVACVPCWAAVSGWATT